MMKQMMSSVQRRAKNKRSSDFKADLSPLSNDWMQHKSLPRSRMSRTVKPTVFVENLPSLQHITNEEQLRLVFMKKVRMCCYVMRFDGIDTPTEAKYKELKRLALIELVQYLAEHAGTLTSRELTELFEMFSCNLFRPLPPGTLEIQGFYNPEEDEPQAETSWPHLSMVYEMLLRLAQSSLINSKIMAKYFDRRFIVNLLVLFDSEDHRERDYLKTILHRIYGKYMALRPFIRKQIHCVFYTVMYTTNRHNGIAELLEILGSIVNGFALPIKKQHKEFLVKVLMPMHAVPFLTLFHPQLSYCVTQFLAKDSALVTKVVPLLIASWPHHDHKKEMLFLNELEEIVETCGPNHLMPVHAPVVTRIAEAINSPHFMVAERAIYLLHNVEAILQCVLSNRATALPILLRGLMGNVQSSGAQPVRWQEQGHWNTTICSLTEELLKLMTELDAPMVEQHQNRASQEHTGRKRSLERREAAWAALEAKESKSNS